MRFLLTCAILAASAQAATINTTLTVTNAVVSIGAGGITASGPATLTGIGNGTFTATIPTSAIGGGGGTSFSAPYTITLSNGTDKITGTITVPLSLLSGQSGTGSATVTGGAGAYSGATGSFTSLAGTASGTLGSNLAFSFTGAGTIVTGGPPAPVITAVQDAGSYTSGIALGSIFVIKGTGLSASGFTSTTFPLPATFGGVTITFTPVGGGAGTTAPVIYLYNQGGVNQLAAVVPSTLNPGTYNVTVTNNSGVTSASFPVSVVARKPEIITQDSTGNGLAVIQNFVSATNLTVNRFTTGVVNGVSIAPATPGQTEILWVVGLGAVPGGTDNSASPVYDFTKNGVTVQVIVGGVTITPFYAGRAPGLVGVDQINFTLPANVPTGCAVPVQVVVNGVQSQPTTFMSIAPSNTANVCVQPGFTTQQLQNFDNGATIVTGGFSILQFTENIPSLGGNIKLDQSSGQFTQYSGFQLASIPPSATGAIPTNGACIVTQITSSNASFLGGGGINLDAGKVTLNGPNGSNITNAAYTQTNNTYSLNIGLEGSSTQLPGSINGTIVAGTYSLAGAGGTGVNAFNASVSLGTPLTVTGGLPTALSRASDLMINWTGGNPSDLVEIFGSSTQTTGTTTTGASFICYTTAGQLKFTVPSSILIQLPAGNNGFLGVASGTFPTAGNGLFNFTLASDGSSHQGTFTALVGTGTTENYQ